MKKAFRIITSLCLCAVFVFSALPFHAMALDNRAYTRTYGGETLNVSYSLNAETVVESITIVENGMVTLSAKREIHPDGSMSTYIEDVLVAEFNADYDVFYALASGEANPFAKSVYQVCGSTLPHTLVSTASRTVTKAEMLSLQAGVSLWLGFSSLPASAIYTVVTFAINSMGTYSCNYVDVTEYKYFVQDYEYNVSSNCYHTYLVFYNYASNGQKQIVHSQWNCYSETL